jgi:regulator of sigma E protease
MNGFFTAIIAILAFGFLIFVHELGHFIAARLTGIKVYEFSIGMGPKLVWYDSKKTGIRYKLCMIPLGGYVSMADGVDESAPSDDPHAFSNQKPWKRLLVTVAGGVVNLFVGFLLMLAVVLGSTMSSTVVADFPENLAISETSTADYGLLSGDEILSIGGKRVHTAFEMDYEIMRRGIEPLTVVVARDTNGDGVRETRVSLTVSFPNETEEGQRVGARDFRVYAAEKTFGSVIRETFYRSICLVRMVWESLFDLVTGRYGIEAVSGPVGIAGTMGEAASYGILPFLYLIAMISINLGVINLIPLPALDGGHLLLYVIEVIRRKPVKKEIEGMINFIGLIIILTLAVLIAIKDIIAL